MCACLAVFFKLFGNLARRLSSDMLDYTYKVCLFCWCCDGGVAVAAADSNIDQEPSVAREQFYKNVDRAEAERLLESRQNGTFLMRPSKENVATLSLIQDGRVWHLNVRKRRDGLVSLGNEKRNEKCFRDVDCLINYYISNYLVLYGDGKKTMALLLPYRD